MNLKGNIIPIAFVTALVLITAGVIFAIITLTKGPKVAEQPEKMDLSKQTQLFSNKLDAYEQQVEDSVFSIRDENLKIDLSRVFKNKVDTAEKSEISQLIDDVMQKPSPARDDKPTTQKHQVNNVSQTKKTSTYKTVVSNDKRTTDPAYEPKQEEQPVKLNRKESFNSSFNKNTSPLGNSQTVYAVIHEKQTVHQSSSVKLRITQDFYLNGQLIPSGTFVYGITSFANERVLIKYENISLGGQLMAFNYRTYDSDGIEGVYVPGLIINDMGKEAVNQTTASTRVTVPIVGSVAINTAQKENNKNTAILTQDYKVLLKTN
jgi:hypothetical protein